VAGTEGNLQFLAGNKKEKMSFFDESKKAQLQEWNNTPVKMYFRHPLDRRMQFLNLNETAEKVFHGGFEKLKVPHYDDEGNLIDPYAEEGVYEPVELSDIYPEEILEQVRNGYLKRKKIDIKKYLTILVEEEEMANWNESTEGENQYVVLSRGGGGGGGGK